MTKRATFSTVSNQWSFVTSCRHLSVVTVWRPLVVAILSALLLIVRLWSLLWVVVTPWSSMPLIPPTVTWPSPSVIPTSKLSVVLQPVASISLVTTSSAIPFLNNWRGFRRTFQVFLVLFVILCESACKHFFKIWNHFRSFTHVEILYNF